MSNINSKALRQPNETPKAYRIRLYKNKELYELNNAEIGKLCNEAFEVDWDESAHRKKTRNYLQGYNDAKEELGTDNQQLENMIAENKKLLRDLVKEQVKVRDERTELRRLQREEARRESYKEQFLRTITECQTPSLNYDENKKFNGVIKTDNDLLISLFDIHTGIKSKNFFNTFDEDVLKERLNKYLDKILKIALTHCSENAYVVISETMSGFIHPTLRIENNQDMIEQFLCISNYLTEFLSELSYHFENIHVYIAPGNHGRLSPNKDESLAHENMDNLILPFLQAKLQKFTNIHCHENEIEQSIAMFNIRGNKVFSSHGDKENIKNAISRLTLFTSIKPDIYLCGHYHTNAMVTEYNSKCLQAGSLSGSDEYCMDKRLQNRPEQIVAVINTDGLDCFYDVKF